MMQSAANTQVLHKLISLMDKPIGTIKAENILTLVLNMGQAPKTLDPTFPVLQHKGIFSLDPHCLVNVLQTPQFIMQLFC